jgi:hypothetical protein
MSIAVPLFLFSQRSEFLYPIFFVISQRSGEICGCCDTILSKMFDRKLS